MSAMHSSTTVAEELPPPPQPASKNTRHDKSFRLLCILILSVEFIMEYVSPRLGLVVLCDDQDAQWMDPAFYGVHILKDHTTFYAEIVNRKAVCGNQDRIGMLHRLVMKPPPGYIVDHLNGSGLDCRRANLRITTPELNSQNRANTRNRLYDIPKGVSYFKKCGKFSGRIKFQGIIYNGTLRATVEEAVADRRAFEERFFLNAGIGTDDSANRTHAVAPGKNRPNVTTSRLPVRGPSPKSEDGTR
jgi:hypothetical protein